MANIEVIYFSHFNKHKPLISEGMNQSDILKAFHLHIQNWSNSRFRIRILKEVFVYSGAISSFSKLSQTPCLDI